MIVPSKPQIGVTPSHCEDLHPEASHASAVLQSPTSHSIDYGGRVIPDYNAPNSTVVFSIALAEDCAQCAWGNDF
jgi:hypothetical protein